MRATIVHIDGDDDSRAVLHAILTHTGHRVLTASTRGEGLSLAPEADLVVTELEVPPFKGATMPDILRASPLLAAPILVWTARLTGELEDDLRANGLAVLRKPTRAGDLLKEIEEILSGKSANGVPPRQGSPRS